MAVRLRERAQIGRTRRPLPLPSRPFLSREVSVGFALGGRRHFDGCRLRRIGVGGAVRVDGLSQKRVSDGHCGPAAADSPGLGRHRSAPQDKGSSMRIV